MQINSTRWAGLALALALPAAATAQTGVLTGLDDYVTNAMAQWGAPGFALVVVKDDAVAYARGYGVRVAGSTNRVDTNTLFAIGSCSKAFSAAAVGVLVQEGKLSWDTRVVDCLPDFRLASNSLTQAVTLRDLLAMRSGMGQVSESLWYNSDYSRAAVMRRLPFVPADPAGFGVYSYRNCNYLAAGEAFAAVTNLTWDEVVVSRLFTPLGMLRSRTTIQGLSDSANVAQPHIFSTNRGAVAISYRDMDSAAPCGAVISTASEMAAWLRLHLSRGMYAGTRVLTEDVVATMHAPHCATAPGVFYCLGWGRYVFSGHAVVSHAGQIDGMCSAVGFMPDLGLGFAAMANAEWPGTLRVALPEAILNRVFDAYLGNAPTDWSAKKLADVAEERAQRDAEWAAICAARNPSNPPSLSLDQYVGQYASPVYGAVSITLATGSLVYTRSSTCVFDLSHWESDWFLAIPRDVSNRERMEHTFIRFDLSAGRITNMSDTVLNFVPVTGTRDGLPVPGDYDGDRKADPSVFVPGNGIWNARLSSGGYGGVTFARGSTSGIPVAGDFDGDGTADPALYVAREGQWQAALSGRQYAGVTRAGFGAVDFLAMPADYDGDGKCDPAIYHATSGDWFILCSANGYAAVGIAVFGGNGWRPLAADFDGDGRSDPGIFESASGTWFVRLSTLNYGVAAVSLGDSACVPIPADYTGDGAADVAVYDVYSGVWRVLWPDGGGAWAAVEVTCGGVGYEPVPSDFDGDRRADPAVYQWITGRWQSRLSGSDYAAMEWQ